MWGGETLARPVHVVKENFPPNDLAAMPPL